MIALHARRSFNAIESFYKFGNRKPLIVALTGTDLYKDIHSDRNAQKSLEFADRLVVLQEMGIKELPKTLRVKARVIYQSAVKPKGVFEKRKRTFDVCVVGHLRPVKDPFCATRASRLLPGASKVRVLHAGSALDNESRGAAQKEMALNPRYHWLGEQKRWKALRLMGGCRLLVLSSIMEGGANVISEAAILGIPVLASKISGSIGMLGKDYPGYFPVGDYKQLANLIIRAENDPGFLQELEQWVKSISFRFEPKAERDSLKKLLDEFNLE